MSRDHDIAMAREALRLERQAAARYAEHPAASSDPRLVTYWEALRRNETAHRELLETWLTERGVDPEVEAPAGAGDGALPEAGDNAGRHPLTPADGAIRGHAGDLAALRSDYDFEDEAVVVYGRFAYRAEDRELMELFKELARSESGHRNGLRRTIRAVEGAERPVVLFCPLCGWEIDFGPDPAEGARGKCPMCPGRYVLRLDPEGDWDLERLAP